MKEIWVGNKLNICASAGHFVNQFTISDLAIEVIKHKGSHKTNGFIEPVTYYTLRLSFKGKEFLEIKTQDVVPLNSESIIKYIIDNKVADLLNEIYSLGISDGISQTKREIRSYLEVDE